MMRATDQPRTGQKHDETQHGKIATWPTSAPSGRVEVTDQQGARVVCGVRVYCETRLYCAVGMGGF